VTDKDRSSDPAADRIPPGRFFGLGNRMVTEGVTVDEALELYLAQYPDADAKAARAEMELEAATMSSTVEIYATLAGIGAFSEARKTDPDARYDGPRIPMSEGEYILLTYASSGVSRVILRLPEWNREAADRAAAELIARDLATLEPAATAEAAWSIVDGAPMALVATEWGLLLYETQPHDDWAICETGVLRHPPRG